MTAPAAKVIAIEHLGLHRTKILSITEHWLRVDSLEAINGTPVIDIKPVIEE